MSIARLFLMPEREFLQAYWPDKPYWVSGDPARFGELASLDVVSLMQRAPADLQCMVYLENDPSWLEDISMPVSSARRFLARGNCVEIGGLQELVPEARKILGEINKTMGQSSEFGDCSLFCKSAGKGTPPHFDRTEVFVIQLKGRCTWRIARNPAIENPTIGHYLFDSRQPPAELSIQVKKGHVLPSKMPEHSESIEMEPGMALFLPRGYLHETLKGEDSVSVTFSTILPTPAILFSKLVEFYLLGKEEWREPVVGLFENERTRAAAIDKLEGLARRFFADGGDFLEEMRAIYPLVPKMLGTPKEAD